MAYLSAKRHGAQRSNKEGPDMECGVAPLDARVDPTRVVRSDEFGHWACVPGFEDELLVSSRGWVHQKNVRTNEWFLPSQNTPQSGTGDVFVGHRGKDFRVHQLMARAFLGPPPSANHTVDHIAKYGGDFMRERSDNRIENLRWASKSEQSQNRRRQIPRRNGRSVRIWKVGADRSSAVVYESSLAAAKALRLNAGSLSRTAHGGQAQTHGFHAEFCVSSIELVAQDEEFREIDGFYVSQYGRALDPQTKQFAFTPQINDGLQYAFISKGKGDGIHTKSFTFHRLVARAWPEVVGVKPSDGGQYTVDHINRNREDNSAANLRWASGAEQSLNRSLTQTRQKSACAVELRAPNSDEWMQFQTQCQAVRVVNTHFGTRLTQTTVSESIKAKPLGRTIEKGRHKGWSIRKCQCVQLFLNSCNACLDSRS